MATAASKGNSKYWFMVVLATLMGGQSAISATGPGFFLVPIIDEFGYGRAEFSLYLSFMTVATMLTLPLMGRLTDKYGFKKIVILGTVWNVLGYVLLSFCSSLISFYIVGAFLGVTCIAFSTMVGAGLISKWFHKKVGLFTGIVLASTGVFGTIISNILPNLIVDHGWRSGWLLLAAITLGLSLLPMIFIVNKPEDIGMKPYGYDENEAAKEAAGAAVASANTQAEKPSLMKLFFSPKFLLLYVAFVLVTLVAAGFNRHLPAFFTSQGQSPAGVGQLMSIFLITLIFMKALMGALNDKIGITKSLSLLWILYAIAFIIMPMSASFSILAVAMVLMSTGAGSVGVYPPLITRQVFGMKDFATVYAVLYTSTNVGTIAGIPLWGWIFDVTGSYVGGLRVIPVMMIVALACVFISMKVGNKPASQSLSA
ncbi:Oxalate/formate antiporter transporter [Desulfitobacterium hafniense]|uniref:Oxalate/formate antiporter transporter n=1 Tax=Desulfitobacterium hafniense TaxID=49338 RepID=A0A098B7Z2_DESHA|nr:MFS transporter [Desulfitobacterium hafniense]CDX03966.1 Oxalate/formate antiporter transporter [Desulfitobacterium hafniense]